MTSDYDTSSFENLVVDRMSIPAIVSQYTTTSIADTARSWIIPSIPLLLLKQQQPTHRNSDGFSSLLSLRGGGGAEEAGLDLARTTIRLESINTYSIISALVLEAAFKLYTDTDKDFEGDDEEDDCDCDDEGKKIISSSSKWKQATKFVFIVSSMISILCAAYTTVVFSLLGLYSKSALGLGHDDAFLEFFATTAIVRKRAFDAFLLTLMSFELCFTTSLILNYNGKLRVWTVIIAIVAVRVSWVHWQNIIKMAGALLFGSKG